VVDVEERRLRAFEQYRRSVGKCVVQQVDGVGKVRQQALGERIETADDDVDIEERFAERGKEFVLLGGSFFDECTKALTIARVARAHSDTLHFVGVSGADAFQGRAEFRFAARRLVDRIMSLVPGEDEVCERGDTQTTA